VPGCWAAGRLGGWTAGRLDGWAAGRLGGWAAGLLGGWAAAVPGGWTQERLCGCAGSLSGCLAAPALSEPGKMEPGGRLSGWVTDAASLFLVLAHQL